MEITPSISQTDAQMCAIQTGAASAFAFAAALRHEETLELPPGAETRVDVREALGAADDPLALKALYVENTGDTPLVVYGIPSATYSEYTPMTVGPALIGARGCLLLANPTEGYKAGVGGFLQVVVQNRSISAASCRLCLLGDGAA